MKLLKRLLGHERHYDADVVFLSFPKSGRTWHRVLIGSYLAMLVGKPLHQSLHINYLTRFAHGRYSKYTHNSANFGDGLKSSDPSVADPREWAGLDVLLLVRDPRDVLVSGYHHHRYRDGRFQGEISDFIRDPDRGIDKILTAWNRWDQNRAMARTFEIASYEDMLADPRSVLSRSLKIINVVVDENLIERAIDFASFDNMKKYEQIDFFREASMRNRHGRKEAAKVREGRAGGHKAHLSEADLEYIEARCNTIGDPFRAVWSRADAR